jgi:hypothetical protein
MKRNILLVHSLLVLPLLSSPMLFSMDYKGALTNSQDQVKRTKGQTKNAKRKAKKAAQAQAAQLSASAETGEAIAHFLTPQDLDTFIKTEQDAMVAQAQDDISAAAEKLLQLKNPEEVQTLAANIPGLQRLLQILGIATSTPAIETQIVTAAKPVHTCAPKPLEQEAVVINDALGQLAQSVMLPTEEKGFGLFNRIISPFSSNRAQVISHLKNKTFETDNKSFFDLLNNAIQEAIDYKDSDSLFLISDLCEQDEYKNTIRIADDKAQAASDFMSSIYTQQIDISTTNIQESEKRNIWAYDKATLAYINALEDATSKYKANVTRLGQSYATTVKTELEKATDLKERLKKIAQLNASIRHHVSDLTWVNTVHVPATNPILEHHDKLQWRLDSVLRTSKIPTIKTDDQKTAILPVENK